MAFALTLVASTSHAIEFRKCPPEDVWCFDENHVAACSPRAPSLETCHAWIRTLEQEALQGSRKAYQHIGLAYKALADASRDPEESELYQQRAIQTYWEMIARDPSDGRAHLALAAAIDDPDERIELLRRGIALAPDQILSAQFLARELSARGREGDALEASRYMEQAYRHQTGRNKWYLAWTTYDYYRDAGAVNEASRFRQEVLQDLGADELTEVPATADPEKISEVLASLCDQHVGGVLGTCKCLNSIDVVTESLHWRERDEHAQRMADAAADAMSEVIMGKPDLWQVLQERLDKLLANGFDSPSVRQAHAKMPQWEGVIAVH